MPKKPKRRPGYALVAWQPEDVLFLKPEWTLKHCKLWLEANQKYMQARLVEMGWTVWKTCLSTMKTHQTQMERSLITYEL
mgnify:CR=1 FL=1